MMSGRRNAIYLLISLSLLAGLVTGRVIFFTLAYMLVGVIFLSFIWAWVSVRWVAINRRTRSRRAQVGRVFEEQFTVRNRAYIPKLWLEFDDESNLPGHNASHVVPALGMRGRYGWQARTRCTARGEFRLGPMNVSSGDPFGFFTLQRRLSATSRIIIYPKIVQLNHVELPMGSLSGGEAQRRRSHYVTTNASGVRDYAPGDSFNRIHWRSTARKGHLIVKEFEIDPLVDIWLFADFSSDSLVEASSIKRVEDNGPIISTSERLPPSSEEYVAAVSASLAHHFINLERALGFAAYTPNREVHQPERGNRQLTRILETLAVARSLSQYHLGQMLTLETPYFTRGTTLVIVTASTNSEWIKEAQILMRRGIRPVCVFIDGDSFGQLTQSEDSIRLLRVAKIPTIRIRHGDDIASVLAQRPL